MQGDLYGLLVLLERRDMAFSTICINVPTALLVLLASVVPALGFYIGRVIHSHRRKARRLHTCAGCVPATVMHVTLEEKTWREGWVVKAAWMDEKTQQAYIFRSRPQEFRPKQQIGDNVLVFIEATNPMSYSMEL